MSSFITILYTILPTTYKFCQGTTLQLEISYLIASNFFKDELVSLKIVCFQRNINCAWKMTDFVQFKISPKKVCKFLKTFFWTVFTDFHAKSWVFIWKNCPSPPFFGYSSYTDICYLAILHTLRPFGARLHV